MMGDDIERPPRAFTIALNAIRVIQIELGTVRRLCSHTLLLQHLAISCRSREFIFTSLCFTNAFEQIGPSAQARRHERMKDERVAHNNRGYDTQR